MDIHKIYVSIYGYTWVYMHGYTQGIHGYTSIYTKYNTWVYIHEYAQSIPTTVQRLANKVLNNLIISWPYLLKSLHVLHTCQASQLLCSNACGLSPDNPHGGIHPCVHQTPPHCHQNSKMPVGFAENCYKILMK